MADQNSIYCANCKQKTSLTTRRSYNSGNNIYYQIGECNSCTYFYLVKRWGEWGGIDEIFPKTLPKSINQKTPIFLQSDIQEAYACYSVNAYKATIIMARRVIQAICREKGIKKENLMKDIDELLVKQIITKDIRDWAHEIRFLGNDAAHPKKDHNEQEKTVTKDDADDVLSLMEALVDVLYIKSQTAKEMREKRTKNTDK